MVRRLLAAALISLTAAGCGPSGPPPTPLERARTALSAGESLAAEAALREALAQGATARETSAYFGEVELQQGRLAEARKWLAPTNFSDETQALGYRMLGRLEVREGNLPQAGAAFDAAYAAAPQDPAVWVDIGRLRYLGGEQLQAVEASERAVQYGPQNAEALRFRGQLIRDADGMAAASAWFEAALALHPDDPGLLFDYAATLGENGRIIDMLRIVRHIAEIDPANRDIHFLQSVVAARAGKNELARSLLLRSGWLDREVPAARLVSAVIDLRAGNYASAAQTLDQLTAAQPENQRLQHLFARALYMAGSHTELLYRFEDRARRVSASPYLLTLVARAHEALGRRDKAAEYLDKASAPRRRNLIALQPAMPAGATAPRERAGRAGGRSIIRNLIVSGQRDEAAITARNLADLYAGSADVAALLGDAELARGNSAAALASYDRSALVRKPWLLTRRMLAALRSQGRGDDSRALLKRELEGRPFNQEAARILGSSYARQGNVSAATEWLDRALANGGSLNPELLTLRAQVALDRGEPASAMEFARRAYILQPLHEPAARVFARALAAQRLDPAKTMLAKVEALSNRP